MSYKKVIKNALKILLIIVAFIAVERFCHKQTDGFSLHKIQSDLAFNPMWDFPRLSLEEEKEVLTLLDQPFYYLKRGGQCFAFESEDGTTILKLFKLNRISEANWLSKLKFPEFMNPGRLKIYRLSKIRVLHIFTSCKIAYEEFRNETGMLYCHLNKTNYLKKNIQICDNLGISHTLDLDNLEFVVQKKAILVPDMLQSLMEKQDIQAAKNCIDSLLNLFLARYQKGIHDEDPSINKNFGFVENLAVEIDLGSYTKNESIKAPTVYKPQLAKEMYKFEQWLHKNFPVLHSYFQERLNTLTEESVS